VPHSVQTHIRSSSGEMIHLEVSIPISKVSNLSTHSSTRTTHFGGLSFFVGSTHVELPALDDEDMMGAGRQTSWPNGF